MNIAVIFGGISTERKVSIAGGKAVISALKELGHNVIPIDPAFGTEQEKAIEELEKNEISFNEEELSKFDTKSYIDCINSSYFDNIDVAFIVLHGPNGEDGKIQALLELRNIPYTGSNIKASALAIDKNTSKILVSSIGVPTPQWTIVRKNDFNNFELFKEVRAELGNKLVIKPNSQGSTIGITIVEDGNLDDIQNGINLAGKYSDTVLIERFIEGRELTVGIVTDQALPVIEIIPESGFYDFEHKYTKGKTQYICPAEIPDDIAEYAQSSSLSIFSVFGAKGFGRIDFRLDEDNVLYFLELNTIPGFTETSLVPKAAKVVGIEFNELCQMIIDNALEK